MKNIIPIILLASLSFNAYSYEILNHHEEKISYNQYLSETKNIPANIKSNGCTANAHALEGTYKAKSNAAGVGIVDYYLMSSPEIDIHFNVEKYECLNGGCIHIGTEYLFHPKEKEAAFIEKLLIVQYIEDKGDYDNICRIVIKANDSLAVDNENKKPIHIN